jgi:Family of unknown function (DUF6527)
MRFRSTRFAGSASSHSEATRRVGSPGDLALVDRAGLRSLVLRCPDGCGETLTINLDPRAGKAWRFYAREEGISLYPSVWRTTGCRSHFVIWEDSIYWNDGDDPRRAAWEQPELSRTVLAKLSNNRFHSVEEVGDALQEVPWTVAAVCRQLVRAGLAVEGTGMREGQFRSVGPDGR